MDYLALHKPQVLKSVVEVRYPCAARFFDRRGELIRLAEGPEVRVAMADNKIDIEDRTSATAMSIGFFRSAIQSGLVRDHSQFLMDMADGWLTKLLDVLDVQKLRRIGCRQSVVFAADRDFGTLMKDCTRLLHPVPQAAWDVLGSPPSDVGPVFDFDLGHYSAHMQIGPMDSTQMQKLTETQASAPTVGLFVDWDLYRAQPEAAIPATAITEFLNDALVQVHKFIVPFVKALEA